MLLLSETELFVDLQVYLSGLGAYPSRIALLDKGYPGSPDPAQASSRHARDEGIVRNVTDDH
jgi:hypothetical protein